MDSPTMEEMHSPIKTERSLDVSNLLEQLKVARGTEVGEAEGGKSEQSRASIGLEGGPVKVEEVLNVEQTKHHTLEGSYIVMDSNSDVGVNNVENNKPRNDIGDASEIDGSFEVEAICGGGGEGELQGQVSEDELAGNNEAPASGSGEDANQETGIFWSDQNEFLPTSLPTAASVSRWVEGDQLHKVSKS